MTIPRMRTVAEAAAEFRAFDKKTAVTENCVRTLCKKGLVRSSNVGNKILVDLDSLIAYLTGENIPEKSADSA